MNKKRVKHMTWGGILLLCQKHGKTPVLKALEINYQAVDLACTALHESGKGAGDLVIRLGQMAATIKKLENMTEVDISKALEAER